MEPGKFATGHEGDGLPCLSGPRCAPDPMRIVLGVIWKVEVEDYLEVVDIETPRGNIRCNKEFEGSLAEFLHHPRSLHLAEVAMEAVRCISPCVQLLVQLVDHDLCAAEDQSVPEVVDINEPGKNFEFRSPVDLVIDLVNLGRVMSMCDSTLIQAGFLE